MAFGIAGELVRVPVGEGADNADMAEVWVGGTPAVAQIASEEASGKVDSGHAEGGQGRLWGPVVWLEEAEEEGGRLPLQVVPPPPLRLTELWCQRGLEEGVPERWRMRVGELC